MTVFSSFFKVAKRRVVAVAIYLGLMLVMTVMITAAVGDRPGELTVSTQDYRIAIRNEDTGDEVTDALVRFITERTRVRPLPETERALEDALFWRDVDYVLHFDKGFGQRVLAGEAPEVIAYASPNDYAHMYVDTYVNRFLGTLQAYRAALPGETVAHSLKRVEQDLSAQTPLLSAKVDQESLPETLLAWYFSYVSYPLLAALTTGMGMILATMLEKRLVVRSRASSLSERKRNAQLVLAGWAYGTLIWLILVVMGVLTSKAHLSTLMQPKFLKMLLGSYLYMFICAVLALLVSSLTQQREVINGVTNVVALGSSFLAGVFVPVELLGENVVRIGKLLPAYWYTAAVRAVGDAPVQTPEVTAEYWRCMGILVLMLGVLMAATLLVSKHKRAQGTV